MATTSNFGWETPDDTDYVKDGAAAMRTLGNSIDASMADLKGGTTGQVLSKATNTDMDFVWVTPDDADAIQNTIVDAKGDLIAATAADTPARLAVGTNGQVLTADSTTATGLKWANPASGALNFTNRKPQTGNAITTIAHSGSLYVAAGTSGSLFTSTDGQTWTSRTSGFGSQTIRNVTFANNLWVAVGGNGTITTSTDGITWTARTSNMSTNQLNSVTYGNGRFVVVGYGGGSTNTGGVAHSTDGITWTRVSMTPAVGQQYYRVVWNGSVFIVAANSNGTNNGLSSTDGLTWTARNLFTSGPQDMTWIGWDGTKWWGHYNSGGGQTNLISDTTNIPTSYVDLFDSGMIGSLSTAVGSTQTFLYGTTLSWSAIGVYLNIVSVTGTFGAQGPSSRNIPTLMPGTRATDVSPYITANTTFAIFQNATGYVIGDGLGGIWTSF